MLKIKHIFKIILGVISFIPINIYENYIINKRLSDYRYIWENETGDHIIFNIYEKSSGSHINVELWKISTNSIYRFSNDRIGLGIFVRILENLQKSGVREFEIDNDTIRHSNINDINWVNKAVEEYDRKEQ